MNRFFSSFFLLQHCCLLPFFLSLSTADFTLCNKDYNSSSNGKVTEAQEQSPQTTCQQGAGSEKGVWVETALRKQGHEKRPKKGHWENDDDEGMGRTGLGKR